MDNYVQVGTTGRHNDIVTSFIGELFNLIKKREVYAKHEEFPLAFFGTRKEPMGTALVDIQGIDDIQRFTENTINLLESVQPDFMLFKHNPYIVNRYDTKIAGQPDLIIEIWSEGNSQQERNFKKDLYKTSPISEHWYIDQDSNKVECYIGSEQLPDQCLTDILRTRKGLKFDLRYLAI